MLKRKVNMRQETFVVDRNTQIKLIGEAFSTQLLDLIANSVVLSPGLQNVLMQVSFDTVQKLSKIDEQSLQEGHARAKMYIEVRKVVNILITSYYFIPHRVYQALLPIVEYLYENVPDKDKSIALEDFRSLFYSLGMKRNQE